MILFLFSVVRVLSTRPDSGQLSLPSAKTAIRRVEIIGEVNRPGEYFFPSDATVANAISAAGGATEFADPGRLNLDARLLSGSVLRVPNRQTGFVTSVSLNRSPLRELCTLPGIGPKLAQRIIDVRKERGAFRSMEDLMAVPGIGQKKARLIFRRGILR
ncbi:MAG: ComEA family DNA-binding protein [Deltaproteobacteria bacterium]|nr:ComEA family DNA-binding protein [Deltaproteobacteria bacterium]